jgi:hypothetical protein
LDFSAPASVIPSASPNNLDKNVASKVYISGPLKFKVAGLLSLPPNLAEAILKFRMKLGSKCTSKVYLLDAENKYYLMNNNI